MTDVFEEVEGRMRAERYRSLGEKLAPWIVGLLLLAALAAAAVWGYREWRARAVERASMDYAAGLDALQAGRPADADRRFAAAAESRAPTYRALAMMQRAGLRLNENKPREAVALLDAAAEATREASVGDAARLKAALLIMDYGPFEEVQRRLRPLTEDGRPYRSLARETLAMAQVAAGRLGDARREFVVLSQTLDASQGARSRAQAMVAAIDSGAAARTPEVLRAAPGPATPGPAPGSGSSVAPRSSSPAQAQPSAPQLVVPQ